MYRIINNKKKYATMAGDLIGNLVFRGLGLVGKKAVVPADTVERILIIRTAYLGDVMMTVPMLKPLKQHFKNAHITFLTSASAATILENNPYIDEIVPYDPFWFYPAKPGEYLSFMRRFRRRKFDLVIEARGDIRDLTLLTAPLKSSHKISYDVGGGGFLLTKTVPHPKVNHRVHYHLDIASCLGATCDYTNVEWGVYLTDAENKALADRIREMGIQGDFWSAHPGSRVPLKQWSAEKYAESFDRISDYLNLPLVLLGGPGDVDMVTAVKNQMKTRCHLLCGKTSLREMAGLLKKTRLFVCNDSAPMHLAAASNTPTVALFGPSKSDQTGPYASNARVVKLGMACRQTCDESTCINQQFHACMRLLTPQHVMDAVSEMKPAPTVISGPGFT